MRVKTRIILLILLGVVAVLSAIFGRFSYSSCCTVCGSSRETTEWQVVMLPVPLWRSHAIKSTPLSTVVDRNGLAPQANHNHQWLFAAGGGNGVMCAIGSGRHLWSAMDSREVAAAVDAIARYQGREPARRWLTFLLNPNISAQATRAFTMAEVPATGFTTREEFDLWWRNHQADLLSEMEHLQAGATTQLAAPVASGP